MVIRGIAQERRPGPTKVDRAATYRSVEVTVHEFFVQLLFVAAVQYRDRAKKEHGPFMPAEVFKLVEQADQFIYDADRSLAKHL